MSLLVEWVIEMDRFDGSEDTDGEDGVELLQDPIQIPYLPTGSRHHEWGPEHA